MIEVLDPELNTLRHEIRELKRSHARHIAELVVVKQRLGKLEATVQAATADLRMYVQDMRYDDEPEPEVPLEREEGEDG